MIECPDCHKTIVDPCAVILITRLREQLDVVREAALRALREAEARRR